MRIAILSNVTAEVLAGMFGGGFEVWTPPGFGAWMETALEPPPEMRAFAPDAVFLLLDSARAPAPDPADVRAAVRALENTFPAAAVAVPDLEDLADASGGGFHDDRMWTLGRMPWSLRGLRAIRGEIERLAGAMRGGARKVLALDFDNTLWRGVAGEDGPGGIAPYSGFQRAVKEMKERGVLLAGLSKNNAADVAPAWSAPGMVLSPDDFAAVRVDWNDKPGNLASVAAELNLGVDSFVFVDDNPAERARMKAALPEVEVPDFPAGPDDAAMVRLARRIARLYFPAFRTTGEDRRRTEQYKEEAARRAFAAGRSLDGWLDGLHIAAEVRPAAAEDCVRIAQLSQKTNQFNVLTNRRTAGEIRALAESPDTRMFAVRAEDRFGPQGLVAFVALRVEDAPDGAKRAEILDLAMSCRAMNRTLEFAVEEAVEKALAGEGVRELRASYRPTAKNAPVAELFDRMGFAPCGEPAADGTKNYTLKIPRNAPLRHRVTLKG